MSADSAAMVSMGLQAYGAMFATIGAFRQTQLEKMSLKYDAQISDLNAKLAQASAESVLLQGASEASRLSVQVEGLKGQQRVAMIANGIDINQSETAKNIIESTDYLAEQDISTIKANAMRAAFGYKTQAINYSTKAAALRAGAKSLSPIMNAATTAITSATGVSNSWGKLGGFSGGNQYGGQSPANSYSAPSKGFTYNSPQAPTMPALGERKR